MQTEKRHPIARALHIIGFGRTTLNNYIYGPGAVLSAIFGEAGESLEDHIGPNCAPVCENQRWLRRYLTDEAVVVLSIGFRLIRCGVMPELISAEDLARQMLFSGVNGAFRDWCALMRIHPVPGRRGVYDPALVRRRLDEAQGLLQGEGAASGVGAGLVAQRRARRGAA